MISIQKLYFRKNIALCLACLIFLSSIPSCNTEEAEPEILYPGETMLLEDGSPIYVEDAYLDAYIAKDFYTRRREGDPDPKWENIQVGVNGEDYKFELTEEVFSLSSQTERWGVRVYFVSDTYLPGHFISRLNLEKYEDGEWVRQAVLIHSGDVRTRNEPYGKGEIVNEVAMPLNSEQLREILMSQSPLTIRVDRICPAPTPGKYRFVFYAQLWREEYDKKPLNRMYYIPFEVVE